MLDCNPTDKPDSPSEHLSKLYSFACQSKTLLRLDTMKYYSSFVLEAVRIIVDSDVRDAVSIHMLAISILMCRW